MKPTTITPEEFEKALARACMKAANRWMIVDPFRCGYRTAVLTGPHLDEIAREAGLSVPQARRRMQKLQETGKVLRHDTRGGSTCWWLVGLAPSPVAAPAAPISLPAFAPAVHATPSPATAPRQGVTTPAPVPARQHWSDVLGVARDCSTRDATRAYRLELARLLESDDLEAPNDLKRLKEAYSACCREHEIQIEE